jgi:hypothetical protein
MSWHIQDSSTRQLCGPYCEIGLEAIAQSWRKGAQHGAGDLRNWNGTLTPRLVTQKSKLEQSQDLRGTFSNQP